MQVAAAEATNTVTNIQIAMERLAEAMPMEQLHKKCASADPILQAECRGYMAGVVSTRFLLSRFMSRECPMVDDSEALRQAFLRWAKNNPNHAERTALESALLALGIDRGCSR
jgi:Rap1a immunity proteins